MEKQKTVCEKFLLYRHEIKTFLHQIVTGDKKWIYSENPKTENHCLTQDKHEHRLQDRIALERQCCTFSGIRRVLCTMKF